MGIHKPTGPSLAYSGYPLNTSQASDGYTSGSLYSTWAGNSNFYTTDTASANFIYSAPFYCRYDCTISHLVADNSGSGDAGDDFRIGIYDSTAVNVPNSLLQQSGEIALDGSSDVRVADITDQALEGGKLYWIALVTNASISFSFQAYGTGFGDSSLGVSAWNSGGSSLGVGSVWYAAHTYAALPSSAPTPIYYNKAPVMGVKIA
tara:strand:+ start:1189 stop:1803 length:615 start_codon:yes stop_codon:yes gene_type:complete